MFPGQATELCHIVLASKVKLSFPLFVNIPEHIDADGVHAQSLAGADTMLPIWTRNTRVVNFSSLYYERLSIQQESTFTNSKVACINIQ
jgi:hypothetical protein